MNSKFSMKMLLVLIAISLIPAYVFAEEVGKITYIEGRVDTFKQNDKNSQVAREYDTLSVGDSVRTKSNSKAEIKFKDGTILRLAQNSKIRIEDYQFDQKGKRKRAAIALERGKVRTIIAKMPQPADFDIITPNAKGVVKGSDIFAFYQAGASGMLVAEGALSVVNTVHPGTPLLIPSGNSVLIPLEKAPEGPRPYLDLEEKLHEQDTNIPFSAVKSQKISTITAQIAKFQGEVKVINKGQTGAHPAKLNEVLMEGDEIQTGSNGLAEIRLDNSNALNLKPNTKLLIVKLVFNPQTREYENIFEVTIGKVKARVEGMKGKSKFEIKTPLAICGVRGTILYVTVAPDGTTTLVEGGNGYITHLISGITQNIGSGENSSANNQGGVTNPTPTSQGDREGFTEGWDIGNGTEGYSAPGGTTSITYNTNTQINNGIINTGTGNDTNQPVDVPVTESGVITTEESATLNGSFAGAFGFYEDELYGEGDAVGEPRGLILDCGTINNGVITATGDIWAGSSQPIALTADFNFTDTTSNHDLDLWATTEDFNLAALTTDGSTIIGLVGGIKNSNYLKGISYSFYIKPDGSVGYVKSADLSGSLSGILSGTLALSGTITTHQMGMSDSSIEIQGFSEDALINGKVAGDISGVMDLSHALIKDQHWGLWRMGLGGSSISTALPNNWSAVVGGKDEYINHTFRFLMDINGTSAGNNELFGTVSGIGLDYDPDSDDPTNLGYLTTILDGEFRGIYDNQTENWWEAIAAGVYTETPFTLGANSSIGEESPNEFGYFDFESKTGTFPSGSLTYSLGATGSLWEDTAQLTILGEFSNPDNYKLWDNEDPFGGRTIDGARFYTGEHGYLGGTIGTSLKDSAKGLFYAFYIRPNSSSSTGYSAGYLKSTDLSGNFYSSINMFKLQGSLTHNFGLDGLDLTTTISPENITANVKRVNNDSFGKVSGNGFSGDIISEAYYIDGQNWGLWTGASGGTYTDIPTDGNTQTGGHSVDLETEQIHAYWLGKTSDNTWQGDENSGTTSGTISGTTITIDSLQTFTGDSVGNYENGIWQALSAGVWTSTPLQFVSSVSYGYKDNYENVIPVFSGLLGATQSAWSGTSENPVILTFIGQTEEGFPADGKYHIWGTDLISHDYVHDTDATYDNGAYYGMIGGLFKGSTIEGKSIAIYIDKDGKAGIVYGILSDGTIYDDIDMFETSGVLIAEQKGEVILDGVSPADYLKSTYDGGHLEELNLGAEGSDSEYPGGGFEFISEFEGTINGGISIHDSTVFSLDNQKWGIWAATIDGNYDNLLPAERSWRLGIGGGTYTADYGYGREQVSCWLGTLSINEAVDNKLTGNFNGLFFSDIGDGYFNVSTIKGDAAGYVEANGDGGANWQAGAIGDWVEVAQLNPGFSWNELRDFVSNPVMEEYSTLEHLDTLQLVSATSGITSAAMDMNLYASPSAAYGIWTAIINGTYATDPGTMWSMTLAKNGNSMTLNEGTWINGQWTANVSEGMVGGHPILGGQAAGTYGDNKFQGVGAGTYGAE